MTARLALTVVGSAAAWSRTPGRASSCYLVESGDDAIVLDLGQGSFAALAGYRDPAEVRAVLISHLHPDHGVDLVPLRHYLRYGVAGHPPIELHAPPALRARYDALAGERDFLSPLTARDLAAGTRAIHPFRIAVARVTHAAESHAFRVSVAPDAPGLVYSGDCGRSDDLLGLVRPGDTLLCEAYFADGDAVPGAGHLDAGQAADVARRGRAARLILTHVRDGADPERTRARAAETFEGELRVAEPGMRISIP